MLSERSARFGRCFGVEGILAELGVDVGPIVIATQKYLKACRRFGSDVFLLPNWTRNGDLRPRVEVLGEFNQIEVEVQKLFRSISRGGIGLVQRVLSVRVKGGPEVGGYSSAHLHTDTWAGEPSGGVVMIPIEGDFNAGGVEFYRPTKNLECLLKAKEEGYSSAGDFGPELIGKMSPGRLYVLDAACLHKTMKGQYRVSVDFRFMYSEKLSGDFSGWGKRLANYVPLEGWSLCETNKNMSG